MILAGDIGGTKTHLALLESGKILSQEKYPSKDYPGLGEIVLEFLQKTKAKVGRSCFGIAGPIRDGKCQATNLPWMIDSEDLKKELKTDAVFLINDLEANAYGIKCLGPDEFFTLNEGNPNAAGNQALIAAGTGLGEAGLYWDGKEHHPFACEGGHSDYAPLTEMDMELLRYLHKRFGHVSFERLLSGPGLYNIYRFLTDLRLEKEVDFGLGDAAKIITERALKKECKTCVHTLNYFVKIYGNEAGNLALKMLALGGVYVGGGIAPKILDALKEKTFMEAFVDKGRFKELLSGIPVKVILNEHTALLGAAFYAEKKG